ncbi:hypothetical protein V495_02951 [Pseudogymnoascus sp. VKM F-4514 (FW-929)]|nr:hypothetical protein V495_02951 [Pseudogymnoascus sp. VKM F-4514 (FW-929)]
MSRTTPAPLIQTLPASLNPATHPVNIGRTASSPFRQLGDDTTPLTYPPRHRSDAELPAGPQWSAVQLSLTALLLRSGLQWTTTHTPSGVPAIDFPRQGTVHARSTRRVIKAQFRQRARPPAGEGE